MTPFAVSEVIMTASGLTQNMGPTTLHRRLEVNLYEKLFRQYLEALDAQGASRKRWINAWSRHVQQALARLPSECG